LQELKHDLVPQVSHAAGIASLHECNRFALIVRRLADTFLREEKYQDENRARPKVKKFHFYLRPSFRFFRLKYLTERLQEIFPAKTPSTQRKKFTKFTYFPKLGASAPLRESSSSDSAIQRRHKFQICLASF
jgi:hypothetical protein